MESRDREVVLAREDHGVGKVHQGNITVEHVELFLCLDSGESIDDKVSRICIVENISINVVRDVGQEFRIESNLKQLVEGDELQACQGVILYSWWWRSIGKAAVCLSLNGQQL